MKGEGEGEDVEFYTVTVLVKILLFMILDTYYGNRASFSLSLYDREYYF